MNHRPNNNNNREGNSSDNDNNDNDTGNRSEGPPRKKPKTMIIVDDDAHLSLPKPGTHADNEDIQHAEDKGLLSCRRTRLKDPLLNIFTQPSVSNFRVLDSVPDITQPDTNVNQYETSHTVGAPTVKNADLTTDIPGTIVTTQALKVGDPQTTDPRPNPSGPTVPVTMPTSPVDSSSMKTMHQKRYQCMEKMRPGISLTARNYCAQEWCALNPEGTVGAFNLHWDEVQKDKEKMGAYKKREKEDHAALPMSTL